MNDGAIEWITLRKYCELTGETTAAVKWKRTGGTRRGVRYPATWTDGVEYAYDPRGNLWINIEAVKRWITKNYLDRARSGAASAPAGTPPASRPMKSNSAIAG